VSNASPGTIHSGSWTLSLRCLGFPRKTFNAVGIGRRPEFRFPILYSFLSINAKAIQQISELLGARCQPRLYC
jgi:hypothetical protein